MNGAAVPGSTLAPSSAGIGSRSFMNAASQQSAARSAGMDAQRDLETHPALSARADYRHAHGRSVASGQSRAISTLFWEAAESATACTTRM